MSDKSVKIGLALAAAVLASFGIGRVTAPDPVLPSTGGCQAALDEAAAAGLVLPAGWAFYCPGNTDARDGQGPAAGVACPPGFGEGPAGPCPYIAISPERAEACGTLPAVVAHEVAHSIDYVRWGDTSEPRATRRAANAGFSPGAQCQPG